MVSGVLILQLLNEFAPIYSNVLSDGKTIFVISLFPLKALSSTLFTPSIIFNSPLYNVYNQISFIFVNFVSISSIK